MAVHADGRGAQEGGRRGTGVPMAVGGHYSLSRLFWDTCVCQHALTTYSTESCHLLSRFQDEHQESCQLVWCQ